LNLIKTQKLGFAPKSMYAIGAIADVIMANIIFQLSGPIYVYGLGLSPFLIGLAISIPRIWDAVTDPVMGNISDNTRMGWGRRRPYMFLGALLGGILCSVMWMPPEALSKTGTLVYFLITSMLFFTAYTIYSVPFNALGYELTTDYDERTSVMSYKTMLMNVGSAILLPWAYKLCLLPQFGENAVEGARVVGVLFGLIIFFAGFGASVFCREDSNAKVQAKIKMLPALKYTFSNRVFLLLAMLVCCVIIGVFLAFPLMFYINIAYIVPGNEEEASKLIGLYGTVYGFMGIIAVPIINLLGQKFGKKPTLFAGLILLLSSFPASWFLFTPDQPKLQLVFALMASPGLSFVWVLTSAMMADVCDLDELKTGLRREGVYGAIFTFLVKLGLGSVMALSGLILGIAGFNQELKLQSPETVFKMRILFMFLPLGMIVFALILVAKYPLSRCKMKRIRNILNRKKTVLNDLKT
jgi:GPH family glycoside/pentoside/hexuronide:cation symporter